MADSIPRPESMRHNFRIKWDEEILSLLMGGLAGTGNNRKTTVVSEEIAVVWLVAVLLCGFDHFTGGNKSLILYCFLFKSRTFSIL
jgi:hypothetical protein